MQTLLYDEFREHMKVWIWSKGGYFGRWSIRTSNGCNLYLPLFDPFALLAKLDLGWTCLAPFKSVFSVSFVWRETLLPDTK